MIKCHRTRSTRQNSKTFSQTETWSWQRFQPIRFTLPPETSIVTVWIAPSNQDAAKWFRQNITIQKQKPRLCIQFTKNRWKKSGLLFLSVLYRNSMHTGRIPTVLTIRTTGLLQLIFFRSSENISWTTWLPAIWRMSLQKFHLPNFTGYVML